MKIWAVAFLAATIGCGGGMARNRPGGVDGGSDGGGAGSIPGCDPSQSMLTDDKDHDGYTPEQGDCNDCNPLVNPGAVNLPGDPTDYACNGMPGIQTPPCDTLNDGKNDPMSLAQAMELCDQRFIVSATMVAPSDPRARKVVGKYGVVKTKAGRNMVVLSTGLAGDEQDASYVVPQQGTELSAKNTVMNPDPTVPALAGCSMDQPMMVNDYSEFLLKLKAPSNAYSFSFNFQFLSAEYPEFVCTNYNDEFLVMQESANEFGKPQNISFDDKMNPITVNNGLFTVCTNDTSKPQAMHCTQPVSGINGTGYEVDDGSGIPVGGSTGWLTTTSPVSPGEVVTLHFMIFDEGDHIYDSAVLIDNFQWSLTSIGAPMTIP